MGIYGTREFVRTSDEPQRKASSYASLNSRDVKPVQVKKALNSGLLAPTPKIDKAPPGSGSIAGVSYICRRGEGDDKGRIILSWNSSDKDLWRKVLEIVKAFPQRAFNPATKMWDVPDKPNMIALLEANGWKVPAPVVAKPEVQKPLIAAPDPVIEQTKKIKAVTLEPCRPLIPGLYPYQVDFVRFMSLRKGRAALGDDMGTGKTVQALAWLAYSGAFPALIVVNAPTKSQWAKAFRSWLGKVKELDPMFKRVGVLSGRKPFMMEPGVSYIINWDILSDWAGHIAGGRFYPDGPLAKFGFKLLIGDEVQAIGNPSSKRSKAFRALANVIPGLIGMSGTPARSKPAQFWPLLNILSPSKFPNYFHYLNRYCAPKSNGFGVKYDGASHVQELHGLLVDVMVRRTKKDVMKDLPPKTVDVVTLEPDAKALAEYKLEEAEAFSDDMSKTELRERIKNLLRSAYALKEKPAIDWVRNFLDDTENKLLIFAWHRDVVDLISAELRQYNPSKLYGGMSMGDRDAACTKFVDDPSCRVMVANIQAGGVGIDGFQKVCSHCVFMEFSYTPNDHRQAEDRLHRGGQGMPVNSYYLVAKDTVDMEAIEVLDQRAKMLDGVMDGKAAADMDLLTEIMARHGR